MSFITKRERVFNDYDLFDLPARNEGKLKAYASCTDARAWSHFCSDKTEHLVDIIKRNNDTCRPKYIPTDVIVDTIMVAKNAEIGRLRRKIEEFEQMLAAYDQLDLTCEQKCEIADAHAAIKEANKELDELFLDLDISGFTEGMESEAYETGKSRGDELSKVQNEWIVQKEPPPSMAENKSNQVASSPCDASTNVTDPRIQQMKDALINKDAKMSAMQNTIAVMENDVCEPYCIYAHIYTALEKIFGILCQNDKYKLYLNLMTAGKDTRCIDIKGRILFKLKVLEKFCQALIAPCTQAEEQESPSQQDCSCYRAEIKDMAPTHTFALTSAEIQKPVLDSKRAHLVADIMENDEMKEILRKESSSNINKSDDAEDFIEDYDIETENLKRLKNLQEDYDDLMTCYESLKHEKEDLLMKCHKYEQLDKDYLALRNQLEEYNLLWNEKEHYRKRSADLDSLKEQYLILSEETAGIETQLKAETEINKIKANTIEELRNENIALEKKLNDALIAYEKEKNIVQCKLQETECKCLCQEQQIKSLSTQIDRLLEQEPEKSQHGDPAQTFMLINEVESLKEQIKNLKDALLCSEEEKQSLHDEFQDNLKIINDLRLEIEDWKSSYEKAMHRNNYYEEYVQHFEADMNKLVNENKQLSQDVDDKSAAVDNLINVINNKSQEINKLLGDVEIKENENKDLYRQLQEFHDIYDSNLTTMENEKKETLESLSIARRESEELEKRLKDYENVVQSQSDLSKNLEVQIDNYNQIKQALLDAIEENKNLQSDLTNREKSNAYLRQEIQKLQDAHSCAINNIDDLHEENNKYKHSLELTRKKSETLSQDLQTLRETHDNITADKRNLEKELRETRYKLEDARYSTELTRKESKELKAKSENLAVELSRLNDAYQNLLKEKHNLYKELTEKNKEISNLQKSLDDLKDRNNLLQCNSKRIDDLEQIIEDLHNAYDKLDSEKQLLQLDLDTKNEEFNNLCNNLEAKIDENSRLSADLNSLRHKHKIVESSLDDLSNENLNNKQSLVALRKESNELLDKLKYYEHIEQEYRKLKQDHNKVKNEKKKLQEELNSQLDNLRQFQKENNELHKESQTLLRHSEHLENALVDARTQLAEKSGIQDPNLEIRKEIEDLQKEKSKNLQRIRDLSNELEVMENTLSNLTQDISARDDKIALLENHINKLKDEITRLHGCLSVVIDAGEELKTTSYEKIGQSLEVMEAHHSKAAHNMKMDIANLQKEKSKLESQMSLTKIKTEESVRENNRYKFLLTQLQNDRDIIATDIKQLELQSVGDSSLSPSNCDVESVLESLNRIRQFIDQNMAKNNSLEQALMKVQMSSQVLVSEAKDLVEKEKQKILNEKEDAIRDKQYLLKQLEDQKLKLETQIANDKQVIQDLEAEVMNQKLIIGKLNESTGNYISKLEEEMNSLQTLYRNAMETTTELKEKLQSVTEQSNKNIDIIDKLQQELKQKSDDISLLQDELQKVKNKSVHNTYTQTESEIMPNASGLTYNDKSLDNKEPKTDQNTKVKTPDENNMLSILPKQRPHSINEVQILTANVEPSFDFVKNSYLNYKLKQLSMGRLEQQSISNEAVPEQLAQSDTISNNTDKGLTQDNDIVDLYNRTSLHTDSSKAEHQEPETSYSKTYYKDIDLESDQTRSSKCNSEKKKKEDLFVIYKESETDFENKSPDDQGLWRRLKIRDVGNNGKHKFKKEDSEQRTDKSRTGSKVHNPANKEKHKVKGTVKDEDLAKYAQDANETSEDKADEEDDDSVKPKLNIKLPRVATESQSILTTSEGDGKSLDSYVTFASRKGTHSDNKLISHAKLGKTISQETPSLPNLSNDEKFTDSNNSLRVPVYDTRNKKRLSKSEKVTSSESKSVHKLSRVDADAYLIKSRENDQSSPRKLSKDYGLQYILDAIKKQNDSVLQGSVSYDTDKTMLNQSETIFNSSVKISDTNSPTKANTSLNQSKTSERSVHRSVIDQGIMAKLDSTEDYEDKIRSLTKALENVERDYKKKIEAIKVQYDSNIKSIINEHNTGVRSIQNLHEETLQDIMKIHENEVENLRTLSIEAMRKSEQLEKENLKLKTKIPDYASNFELEPTRISCSDGKKRRKSKTDTHMLTKTNVEAFNVRPKVKSHGPCTCSLDINLSDTIRNIFEQVDIDQRKMAEHTYLKYIANKILTNTVEALDAQELSFLHLKVCRTWKTKVNKEEALQKKIDTLESELMSKQRNAQQHIAELDRKVAEERRRLQEVREAVCKSQPDSRSVSPTHEGQRVRSPSPQAPPPTIAEKDPMCGCSPGIGNMKINERRSAGDLVTEFTPKHKRAKESNRAVLARMDAEERRERRLYHDEPPTRLRRGNPPDRHRHHKK